MSPFRETRVYRPKVRIANIRRYRAEAALNGPVTDRRASFTATVPSSSGPACKHTPKFEPAAWSWAQMTSGSGALTLTLTLTLTLPVGPTSRCRASRPRGAAEPSF
jgi:hypothetical protein